MPCSEKRARLLLARNRARIHRLAPFVIRLKDRRVSDSQFQPVKVKLDPGSKVTGIAVVRESVRVDAETGEARTSVHVLSLFELTQRADGYGYSQMGTQVPAFIPQPAKATQPARARLGYPAEVL